VTRLKSANAEAASEAKDAGATNALARLDSHEDALTVFFRKKFPNLKTRQKSKASVFFAAYHQGREKGESINLSPNLL